MPLKYKMDANIIARNIKAMAGLTGDHIAPMQVMSADGAITLTSGIVIITKGSACLMTLAAPLANTDDGKLLYVFSNSAFAHTLTIPNGLRGAGAGADVGTFAAAVANGVTLFAYQGAWYDIPSSNAGVTFA